MAIMDRINAEITEDILERADDVSRQPSATLQASYDQEPCGCPACDNGVQPGHYACSQPSEPMLKAEAEGLVVRHYTDERADGSRGLSSAWRWFAV